MSLRRKLQRFWYRWTPWWYEYNRVRRGRETAWQKSLEFQADAWLAQAEVERLRAEVERLDAALEESQGDLDQLESDIGEHLPAYLLDEDDVANYRERVEYAGRDLKMLEAEVSQLRVRVAELEKALRVALAEMTQPGCCGPHGDAHEPECPTIASLEAQLAASQAALEEYGVHKHGCQHLRAKRRRTSTGSWEALPCQCGLDAALQAQPERPATVGADEGGDREQQ